MGIKVGISFLYIWVKYSGSLVPINYITGCRCRAVASSHLLMVVTSTNKQARVSVM